MKVIPTEIDGVMILEPKVFGDARGYFFESWNEAALAEAGIHARFIQDNESKSRFGVLRGLHYQAPPYTQAKLVRVICGAVLDVAVDIRRGRLPSGGMWRWSSPGRISASSSFRGDLRMALWCSPTR